MDIDWHARWEDKDLPKIVTFKTWLRAVLFVRELLRLGERRPGRLSPVQPGTLSCDLAKERTSPGRRWWHRPGGTHSRSSRNIPSSSIKRSKYS